jgi:hypothetical protein
MRQRIVVRFAEPDLHAELLSRVVMGNIVNVGGHRLCDFSKRMIDPS